MELINSKISNMLKLYRGMNVAVKASLWFAVCSIIQRGISVITLPIFTRLMSTSQYGEYSVFLTWYNILMIIVTLNIQSDIFNKGLIEHSNEKNEFTANQTGLLICLSAVFLVIFGVVRIFSDNLFGIRTELFLVMVFEILANAIIGIYLARKRFDFEYRKIIGVVLFTSIANPILGIGAVLCFEQKAEARIISNAIVPIAVAIVLVAIFKKSGKLFGKRIWWKTAVLASIPLIPHYLSLVLLNQSDKLMINYFVGADEAGIYSVAHSAGLIMTIVNTSINGSFVPWVYKKMKSGETADVKKITTYLMGIVLLVNVLVIWLAPEVVSILAAPQYKEAIWCLVPISMSVFFFFAYTLFVDIEIYYGANHYIAIASIVAAVLNLVLNYIFIPIGGYLVAGYTTLISYFATMILHFFFMKKAMKRQEHSERLFNTKALIIMSILLCLISFFAMCLFNFEMIRIALVLIVTVIVFIKREKILAIFGEMKKNKM